MATLEIHDGRNQVRRVRITRENPAMFGSDPMCDIVLDGPGVQPFHGRIRWKTRRFKADASPEVPWIEVNGLQVKSKSIYQGDEIRVGACRIFLLSLEEGPDHGQRTVIQEAPAIEAPARSRPDRPDRPVADFLKMEMAPPSIESPVDSLRHTSGTPEVSRSSGGRSYRAAASPVPSRTSTRRVRASADSRRGSVGSLMRRWARSRPRCRPWMNRGQSRATEATSAA